MNTKFEGENAVVSLSFSNGKPKPTLSGLGKISSSVSFEVPAPNCNWRVVLFKKRVVNLLYTPFNCKRYGVSPWYWDRLGSFTLVFLIESNTVSCAR